MRPALIACVALALAAPAAPTAAQAGQAQPAPEAERLALGRRMAEAGDFNAIIGAVGAAEVERMALETPGLDEGERARLRATGERVLAAERRRLLDAVAPIYARNFTREQLSAIVAFLESPAGRAYTGGFPRVVPEIAAAMQGADLGAAVRAEFCRETGKLCGEASDTGPAARDVEPPPPETPAGETGA